MNLNIWYECVCVCTEEKKKEREGGLMEGCMKRVTRFEIRERVWSNDRYSRVAQSFEKKIKTLIVS